MAKEKRAPTTHEGVRPKLESVGMMEAVDGLEIAPRIPASVRDQLKAELDQLEGYLSDLDLVETLLKIYGIEVSLLDEHEGIFELAVTEHFHDERLPDGYAYKGGAARTLLQRALKFETAEMPRDVDIVNFNPHRDVRGTDHRLGAKFMAQDVETGYGIEKEPSMYKYFDTRDLTINEVLATDRKIYASRAAILDTIRGIVRLTDYENRRIMVVDEKEVAGPRDSVLAKAVRMYTDAVIQHGGVAMLSEDVTYGLEMWSLSNFWLAVNLDRALERGPDYAQRFVDELIKYHQFPETVVTVTEAVNYLISQINARNFYFRHAPEGMIQVEVRAVVVAMEEEDPEAVPVMSTLDRLRKGDDLSYLAPELIGTRDWP